MSPVPVIKWFYCLVYLITLGEAMPEFLRFSGVFTKEHFEKAPDAQTVNGVLILFACGLCIFLAVNYFFVEQFEAREGVFVGVTLKDKKSKGAELILRTVLFVIVSLKFMKWTSGVDDAARYFICMLAAFIFWFLCISFFSNTKDEMPRSFSALRYVISCGSILFLILFVAAYVFYRINAQYALLFVIGSLLASVILIIQSVLVATLLLSNPVVNAAISIGNWLDQLSFLKWLLLKFKRPSNEVHGASTVARDSPTAMEIANDVSVTGNQKSDANS